MRHGLGRALAIALVLALAGCAEPEGVFRADRADPLLAAPPLTQTVGAGVWVGPVAGEAGEPFRHALAQALLRRDVPAGFDSVGALGARLTAAPGVPTHAGAGYVDVAWRLERADGVLLDAFVVPTPLDYRIERPETKAAIGQVADRLARIVGPKQAPQAAGAIVVAVPPAETKGFEDGGPLARAMASALVVQGFQPDVADAATAVVRARAEATPAGDGAVRIAIRWAVLDRAGREVGAAEQANVLPAELARNGFAAIAADAAAAASESVAGLVRLAAARSTAEGAS